MSRYKSNFKCGNATQKIEKEGERQRHSGDVASMINFIQITVVTYMIIKEELHMPQNLWLKLKYVIITHKLFFNLSVDVLNAFLKII